MINNYFSVVGVFTSNFDLCYENDILKIYQATIEVEKNRIGGVVQMPIKVFDLQKNVDFKQILRGKLAMVSGRIDISFAKGSSTPELSLICDNLKVLSGYEEQRQKQMQSVERNTHKDKESV